MHASTILHFTDNMVQNRVRRGHKQIDLLVCCFCLQLSKRATTCELIWLVMHLSQVGPKKVKFFFKAIKIGYGSHEFNPNNRAGSLTRLKTNINAFHHPLCNKIVFAHGPIVQYTTHKCSRPNVYGLK